MEKRDAFAFCVVCRYLQNGGGEVVSRYPGVNVSCLSVVTRRKLATAEL